ncbi:ATP-grasp domain-containing protein [Phytohabitans sp. ZYX-F-186]|uniref:ATP-grasp domain-containing protein n=1 Tax=Phytohabitans maris TaxID=3071409 RepID=A0ABU0ZDG1_9ACTN|nr:ATP-grasp domain-containing protein [Phytohabitans sp. ZYX-F-186]MDQ7904446.1 ATP-grasp domain-containing protein [Phytohabitans sp. ZYX-F-186]
MPRVLVTGAGGPAGTALLAVLAERGVPAVGADMLPLPPRAGVPIERILPAGAPLFESEVLRLAARHRVDLVVPTVTEELPRMAALAAARAAPPRIAVGTPEAVAVADDKWRTVQVLARAGIAVPRSVVAGTADPVRVLGLPYLSKPRHGRGGRGVSLHHEPGGPRTTDHVLQEYVPGDEYAVQLYGAVSVVLRKTALAQGHVGNGVAVVREEHPDVAAVARAAVGTLGLTGPVDVDVRRRADGTPVVLEVNARFGAHLRSAPELVDQLLSP